VATLATPTKLRELQRTLYQRAKKEPNFRAYAMYDKVYRMDVSITVGYDGEHWNAWTDSSEQDPRGGGPTNMVAPGQHGRSCKGMRSGANTG